MMTTVSLKCRIQEKVAIEMKYYAFNEKDLISVVTCLAEFKRARN